MTETASSRETTFRNDGESANAFSTESLSETISRINADMFGVFDDGIESTLRVEDGEEERLPKITIPEGRHNAQRRLSPTIENLSDSQTSITKLNVSFSECVKVQSFPKVDECFHQDCFYSREELDEQFDDYLQEQGLLL